MNTDALKKIAEFHKNQMNMIFDSLFSPTKEEDEMDDNSLEDAQKEEDDAEKAEISREEGAGYE